jgi:hypothetical protein
VNAGLTPVADPPAEPDVRGSCSLNLMAPLSAERVSLGVDHLVSWRGKQLTCMARIVPLAISLAALLGAAGVQAGSDVARNGNVGTNVSNSVGQPMVIAHTRGLIFRASATPLAAIWPRQITSSIQ